MCYNVANLRIPFLIVSASVMPRRPAVLLTPPHSTPDSSLACPELRRVHSPYTSFVYKNEDHPLSPQPLAHSYTKTPECHPERFLPFDFLTLNFRLDLTPLSATLIADLRVLPCFGRNRPPATPLDATLTDLTPVTPLSATLTKTPGGGGHHV
jgi:hypothetical protein